MPKQVSTLNAAKALAAILCIGLCLGPMFPAMAQGYTADVWQAPDREGTALLYQSCQKDYQRVCETLDPYWSAELRKICNAKELENPKFRSIAAHLPAYPQEATIPQLSDKAKLAKSDGALLLEYIDIVKNCDMHFAYQQQTESVLFAAIMKSERDQEKEILADLISGTMNWGAFNKRRSEIYSAGNVQEIAEIQRIGLAKQQAAKQLQADQDTANKAFMAKQAAEKVEDTKRQYEQQQQTNQIINAVRAGQSNPADDAEKGAQKSMQDLQDQMRRTQCYRSGQVYCN